MDGAARLAALCGGAEAHGLQARRIGPYTPTVANGAVAADAALREDTTALVAHNDLLAIGIMRRLETRGVRVPEDVSVVGFDDIFAADFVRPGLTTLGGRAADAGRQAVELLLARIGTVAVPDAADQLLLPTELVIRQST